MLWETPGCIIDTSLKRNSDRSRREISGIYRECGRERPLPLSPHDTNLPVIRLNAEFLSNGRFKSGTCPSQISFSGGSLEGNISICRQRIRDADSSAPILSAQHSFHIWHPSTKIAWYSLWLDSEQDHESDQSGHTDAAIACLGRRNREHHRDRAPARAHAARDHAADEATGGTYRQGPLHSRRPAAVPDRRRRHGAVLRAGRSFDFTTNCCRGSPRPTSRATSSWARPTSTRPSAALDPRDFPQAVSAHPGRAALLAVDPAGRMVQRGEVDIALVTRMNDFTGGQVVRQEQLIWMIGRAIRRRITKTRCRSRCCRRATSIATMRSKGWSRAGANGASPASARASAACRRPCSPAWRSRCSVAARWCRACARSASTSTFPPLPKVDLLLYRAMATSRPRARCTTTSRTTSISMTNCCRARSCRYPRTTAAPAGQHVRGRNWIHGRAAFEGRRDAKDRALVQPRRDDLQSDRQPVAVEAARNRGSRQAGQIDRPRERRPAEVAVDGAPSISSTPSVPAGNAVTATVGVTSASTCRKSSRNEAAQTARRCSAST